MKCRCGIPLSLRGRLAAAAYAACRRLRTEATVPVEDLGKQAAELVSLSNGEVKALRKLAELAVRQVSGCAAAHATVWRDGELVQMAATHPDAAELADLSIENRDGPLIAAVRGGALVSCPDTLTEDRWPRWSEEALWRGVRCSAHLVRQVPPATLVLSLFGVRPGALDADSAPVAEMLARFGGTVFANTIAYDAAQRTATQLKDSVAARAVTDQAKGILMHALGFDADEALKFLRQQAQRRRLKVTEVAAMIIETQGRGQE
jgi:ANTAR domain